MVDMLWCYGVVLTLREAVFCVQVGSYHLVRLMEFLAWEYMDYDFYPWQSCE